MTNYRISNYIYREWRKIMSDNDVSGRAVKDIALLETLDCKPVVHAERGSETTATNVREGTIEIDVIVVAAMLLKVRYIVILKVHLTYYRWLGGKSATASTKNNQCALHSQKYGSEFMSLL